MKKLVVLAAMLVIVLATASVALAQEEARQPPEQKAGEEAPKATQEKEAEPLEEAGEEVEATGVIRELGFVCNECARYGITDGASGVNYDLISDTRAPGGGVDLSAYVGERVTVYGILQAVGENVLFVTRVEPADGGSAETVTVTFELAIEGEAPEGQDFYLDSIPRGEAPDLIFCTTRPGSGVPQCESGGTYSGTRELEAGAPFSYEYFTTTPDGDIIVFSAGTETFTGDDTVSATYHAGDPTQCRRDFIFGCGPEDEVTATFELAVEGEPPADATFFATGVFDPRIADRAPVQQLTDPDGDGVYTAAQDTLPGDYQVRIVQGTGTKSCGPFGGVCPGEPTSTIKDFGTVAIEDDETFSASVSFTDGNDGGGFMGGIASGMGSFLPNTGGVTLTLLGAGALLAAGGLLVRRFFR